MANDKYKTRVGINVIEKVISLKEQDQEFLTNKTILSYLGGVSRDFIRELQVVNFHIIRFVIPYSIKSLMSEKW